MNVLFYARDAEANYGDGLLVIDSTAAARAVTLPSPQGFPGEQIAVMNIGTNAVTVTTLGTGAKINESSSYVISTQFQTVRFVANGKDGSAARWYVETEAGMPVLVDAMVYKGVIDCSSNPNYPAANAGDTYKVSVAGKIGGASGKSVQVGDFVICNTDGTAAGTEAQRGTAWDVIQGNIVNAAGIINVPAGNITATDVQAAINELDTEKEIAGSAATAQAAAIAAAAADATTKADAAQAAARPYLVYVALLTQTGTAAPVATVLENTLGGTVVWARGAVGAYTATLSGAFTPNKTFLPSAQIYQEDQNGDFLFTNWVWASANAIDLTTINLATLANVEMEVGTGPARIQVTILVYP